MSNKMPVRSRIVLVFSILFVLSVMVPTSFAGKNSESVVVVDYKEPHPQDPDSLRRRRGDRRRYDSLWFCACDRFIHRNGEDGDRVCRDG